MISAAPPGPALENVVLSIFTVSATQLSCPPARAPPGMPTMAAVAVMIASARNLFTVVPFRSSGHLLPGLSASDAPSLEPPRETYGATSRMYWMFCRNPVTVVSPGTKTGT
jgi:hypothetical protein